MDFPFRTEIEINCPDWKIGYQTPLLFIGSCFSDNIGGILKQYKFPVLLNPFGVIYNPLSISNAMHSIIANKKITAEEIIFHDNLWHSLSFHGSFSDAEPDQLVDKCNRAIQDSHYFLKNAEFLIVTLGTASVYKYIATGEVVSNCHKIPASQFTRFRLNVEDTVNEWLNLAAELHIFNPNLKIIFTVSPVRHLKDGAHGNQLNKATLLLTIDQIITRYHPGKMTYFPAYEIVNDELRDYRFYESDMIHISDIAVNYILEKFKLSFFSNETAECVKLVKSIVQARGHRLLQTNQQAIEQFSESMLGKIEKIKEICPNINFDEEVEHFQNLGKLDKGFC